MTKLDTILKTKKLLVYKVVYVINKIYKIISKLVSKLVIKILATNILDSKFVLSHLMLFLPSFFNFSEESDYISTWSDFQRE